MSAVSVAAPGPLTAKRPAPASSAAGAARCASSRASSRLRAPARFAAAPARLSLSRATPATAKRAWRGGTRIRYQGEGDAGRYGGNAGDLYIVLSAKSHAYFEREGHDLHFAVIVSF